MKTRIVKKEIPGEETKYAGEIRVFGFWYKIPVTTYYGVVKSIKLYWTPNRKIVESALNEMLSKKHTKISYIEYP